MPRSAHSEIYKHFCRLLVQSREAAELTQTALAKKLKRPQSFVSKYESGERRLDVVEFLEIGRALEIDVADFLSRLQADLQ